MNKTQKIVIAEGIFIVGVLVYLFFSTVPTQVFPLHGMTIIEPNFVFEIENGEQVIISVDEQFTNLIILEEDSDVILPPGLYYWKVKGGFRESEVRNFIIQTHVALNLKEKGENYELQNKGNVDLNVTRKKPGLTTGIILEIGESEEVEKDDSKYEGKQNEN